MNLVSSKLHTYILPIGFFIIIVLMISTTLLTTTRIEKTTETIIKNEIQINKINRALNNMSNAELKSSHILVKAVQSRDPIIVNKLISELYEETNRFSLSREEFVQHDLSKDELDLLSEQSEITLENTESVNGVIEFLRKENYEQASFILNNYTLPRSKHTLDIISQLHEAAHAAAQTKSEETKRISSEAYKSILGFNIISILISFLLMLYLNRKQRQNESDLSFLASTDTLTELPNRDNFIRNINQTIAQRSYSDFAIIFFDIDYFKNINDIYGHEVGDKILRRFSQTITNAISPQDILSRFGGDEFVLLLKNIKNKEDAIKFVRALSYELDTSFLINNNEVFISASIGVSTYPSDGSNAKQLLKNADIAMYSAKQSGRNCYQFFSLENSMQLEHEHALSHALQTILKNKNKDNELFLVYQPLVNISDNDFNECEALIRWKNKKGEYVNTAEFIETAEKSNLIQKVNLFVIEEACKQQYKWQQEGIKNIRININLSGNRRIFSELFKSLLDNLGRYNLSPTLFGIELTERTMYEISEETTEDLGHFRNLGMKIAIDDFGTGYSSLSYLKDLPITSLKIDREFITGLPEDKIDVALVKAIITLAHSLDFDVVAEGVETQEQFDFLKKCKCNIAQGYLLHRPLESKAITKLKLVA